MASWTVHIIDGIPSRARRDCSRPPDLEFSARQAMVPSRFGRYGRCCLSPCPGCSTERLVKSDRVCSPSSISSQRCLGRIAAMSLIKVYADLKHQIRADRIAAESVLATGVTALLGVAGGIILAR